ncbi:MAG: HAD family phosphatase [Chloroflexi bacterium]|nr:HAD family phosphatase [Chloroflexota bacterium]
MSYAAILFDLDGVVIDTQATVTQFWQDLAAEQRLELTPADFQQHIYGCPMNHTFDVLFPHLDNQQRQAVSDRLYDYEINQIYTAVPGVIPLLHALKQHNIPTALVTSADTWKVAEVERQLGLAGLFATHITIGEIRRGKPHPDGYLLAAQRLQMPPPRCLVFEDAVSGVQAAVAAGTACIGVRPPDIAAPLVAAGAFHTILDFTTVTLKADANNGGSVSLYLQLGTGLSLPLFTQ